MRRLHRKKPRKQQRTLLPLQRLIVAKEIFSGKPRKQIAADWRISLTALNNIFYEYLEYKIVWRDQSEEA